MLKIGAGTKEGREYWLLSLIVKVYVTHYLIKEGVIPSSYSSPVGLSAHICFHHRLDVVARQLSTLDNSNTNLDTQTTTRQLNLHRITKYTSFTRFKFFLKMVSKQTQMYEIVWLSQDQKCCVFVIF